MASNTMRMPKNVGTRKPKQVNPVRRIMEREQRVRDRTFKEAEAAAAAAAARARSASTSTGLVKSSKPTCLNPACSKPNVVDGTCRNCGRVADDSNIVSEIVFGESSNGSAVVHGSYVAADQGGIRGVSGREFRRVAGNGASEAREKSFREAKALMNQIRHHLNISETMVETGCRLYRVAASANFIQGREKRDCAAITLYAACRHDRPCKVMLIDFADFVKTDVFKLGRIYKDFMNLLPEHERGPKTVMPEDLIWRFAAKLEFYRDTNRVAEAALRIIQRMRYDSMTYGRRPAGICGAALVMAARSLNYRRTVREVVYIAKVTMVTIQSRLAEFAEVPSADMTIDEFNSQEFLAAHHDPPVVYKQRQEWQKQRMQGRKRKRGPGEDDGSSALEAGAGNVIPSIEGPAPSAGSTGEAASSSSTQSAAPSTHLPTTNLDADGFVIPPRPRQVAAVTPQPASGVTNEVLEVADDAEELEDLAAHFSQGGDGEAADDPNSELAMAAKQGVFIGHGPIHTNPAPAKKTKITLPIDENWERDEAELEAEVEEFLQDPKAIEAAKDVEEARNRRKRAREAKARATPAASEVDETEEQDDSPDLPRLPPGMSISPEGVVNMAPEVHEDEFKDDPEVTYCLLSEEEMKLKEQIWANQNKDYMRQRQQKYFKDKREAKQPPKPRRRTGKKAKGGTTQNGPAMSPAEAAENAMQSRAVSTRLNYQIMYKGLFNKKRGGPGSTYGGASSTGSPSATTSRAGSDDDSDDGSEPGGPATAPQAGPSRTSGQSNAQADRGHHRAAAQPEPVEEEEEEADEDGYDGDDYPQEEFDPFADEIDDDY